MPNKLQKRENSVCVCVDCICACAKERLNGCVDSLQIASKRQGNWPKWGMGNFTSAVFNQPLSGFCAGQLSTNRQVCVTMHVFDCVCVCLRGKRDIAKHHTVCNTGKQSS